MTADHLALVAHLLHRRTNLHRFDSTLPGPVPLPVPVDDPAPGEIVRRELHQDPVPRQDPDVVHPHLARDVGQDPVTVIKFDPEHGVREGLDYRPFHFDGILLRQILSGCPPEHAKTPPRALARSEAISIGGRLTGVYLPSPR